MVPEIWSVMDKFFVISDIFLPLCPPNNPKNQNFEIMEKLPGDIIILCRCNIYKWQSYDVWILRSRACGTEFFAILDHFLHFYPLATQKSNFFWKMKKTPEYIITLQMCTINDNHKMYSSWDMECDSQIFSVLDNFLPSPNNPKKQNFEKMKEKTGDIIILHNCTINDNHMMYGSWNMKRDGQKFLLFWTVFRPLTPLTTQKIKILKNWTKFLNILFYTSVPKIMILCYTIPFLRYGAQWM